MANKDFFLSSDDAQTLGNINYMRKSVRVRHTFPKTLKNPDGFAVEREISSSQTNSISDLGDQTKSFNTSSSFKSVQNTSSNFSSEPVPSTPKKRPQGTNMDMFRNMARNIKKK